MTDVPTQADTYMFEEEGEMDALLKIGIDPESVLLLKDAVLEVMGARSEPEVVIAALRVMERGSRIEGTTISECTFNGAGGMNDD